VNQARNGAYRGVNESFLQVYLQNILKTKPEVRSEVVKNKVNKSEIVPIGVPMKALRN